MAESQVAERRSALPSSQPVLVFGASGTIGSVLVRLLAAMGTPVRAVSRSLHGIPDSSPPVEFTVGDLTRPETLSGLFAGVRRVFVVTSDPGVEPAATDAAAAADVELIVKSSALGPGGHPPGAHAAAEAHLASSGVPWVVLRPNAFMQTLARYLPSLVDVDGIFSLPAGSARTSWIDARDIAAAAAAVLTDPRPDTGRVWTLTGPAALSMNDIAADLAAVTGRPLRYRPLATDDAAQFLQARLPAGQAGFLLKHYAAVRSGDFAIVTPDVATLTGRPASSWRTFLADEPGSL